MAFDDGQNKTPVVGFDPALGYDPQDLNDPKNPLSSLNPNNPNYQSTVLSGNAGGVNKTDIIPDAGVTSDELRMRTQNAANLDRENLPPELATAVQQGDVEYVKSHTGVDASVAAPTDGSVAEQLVAQAQDNQEDKIAAEDRHEVRSALSIDRMEDDVGLVTGLALGAGSAFLADRGVLPETADEARARGDYALADQLEFIEDQRDKNVDTDIQYATADDYHTANDYNDYNDFDDYGDENDYGYDYGDDDYDDFAGYDDEDYYDNEDDYDDDYYDDYDDYGDYGDDYDDDYDDDYGDDPEGYNFDDYYGDDADYDDWGSDDPTMDAKADPSLQATDPESGAPAVDAKAGVTTPTDGTTASNKPQDPNQSAFINMSSPFSNFSTLGSATIAANNNSMFTNFSSFMSDPADTTVYGTRFFNPTAIAAAGMASPSDTPAAPADDPAARKRTVTAPQMALG